jgi:hypothetical protein
MMAPVHVLKRDRKAVEVEARALIAKGISAQRRH